MKIVRNLAAVFLLVFVAGAAGGCAGNSQTESTGEYVDDTAISSKVRAEIIGDEQLSIRWTTPSDDTPCATMNIGWPFDRLKV
jgi:hypothetical protein